MAESTDLALSARGRSPGSQEVRHDLFLLLAARGDPDQLQLPDGGVLPPMPSVRPPL